MAKTKKVNPNKTILGSLSVATILSGLALSFAFVSADDVIDEINITVPVSCSLSGVGMNTHNATINNGQSNSAIGETTIKAFCNDTNGFAIYVIGYTDNEDGKNVLTSSTLGSEHDIATGTATSGNTSNWAMKLSTITSPAPTYPIIIAGSTDDTDKEQGDPDYSTFQAVPDDYEKVAYRTSATDTGANAEGTTLTTTYQAYISKTQPAGTYTGQVKYTLIHPHNATKPIKPVTIATAEYLQEVNSCPADLPEEQVYTLKDSRDEQEYKVAKLKDGKCWMVENLNIAGGAALSSEDTDFDSSYELPTSDGWTVSNNTLILPDSDTPGTDPRPYVYNSNNDDCSNNQPCYSYYSWFAATAGSNSTISVGANAPFSICPKGWHLPNIGVADDTTNPSTDFGNLVISYGGSAEIPFYYSETNPTGAAMYNNLGPDSIPNFQLAGGYMFEQFQTNNRYQSSTMSSNNGDITRVLSIDVDHLSIANNYNFMAFPVRCLLKTN
ncbi:hypothetical protein IKD98_00470 [Candidatus Saccharibacteria bacterium]|nr:hypothetical protein [Candidatus Saccharibacteria bacterium]